jgi:uncharacterized damage-inducible protein DinB
MSLALIRRLYDHVWWADDVVLERLRSVSPVPARSMRLLAHVIGAELLWLDRIEGGPVSAAVWPDVDVERCDALLRTSHRRYEAFVAGLDAERLARRIRYTNTAGRTFDSGLEDILVHVAMHGAYHRGQVAQELRRDGHEPVTTDFIAWVRDVLEVEGA